MNIGVNYTIISRPSYITFECPFCLHVFDCALKIIDTKNRQSVVAEVYERVENNISGENTNGDN